MLVYYIEAQRKGVGVGEAGQVGKGGASSRPGTLVVKGPASLLGGWFLPRVHLLTVPPALDERMQIHPKNQNREKQMLGNGWRGLVWTALDPCAGLGQGEHGLHLAQLRSSWHRSNLGFQCTCDFSRCSRLCFSIFMRSVRFFTLLQDT